MSAQGEIPRLERRRKRRKSNVTLLLLFACTGLVETVGGWNEGPRRSLLFAHGFAPIQRHYSRKSSRLQVKQQDFSSIAPLPARAKPRPTTTPEKRTVPRKKRAQADQPWEGEAIPLNIPKLSEVLDCEEIDANKKSTQSSVVNVARSITQASHNATTTIAPPPSSSTTTRSQRRIKEPWKAGYYTSLKSQKRIKNAAISTRRRPPVERASHVLTTFLSIPPERCNAANLVCALTLSAKAMSSGGHHTTSTSTTRMRSKNKKKQFRTLLYQTLDILGQLLAEKALSVRQLCNAVWAIAKHADRDDDLLPAMATEKAPLSTETVVGQAETWDLRKDLFADSPSHAVDLMIDQIAMELTTILEQDSRLAKEGELCMACWAFGVLRKRRRPPGWKNGPQLGQLPRESVRERRSKEKVDLNLIRFEQWSTDDRDEYVNFGELPATDILFNKIGETLLEPLHSNGGFDEAEDVPLRIQKCQWNELANLAWAFATHGSSCSHFSQELMLEVAHETSRRLKLGTEKTPLSRDLAQMIWALGDAPS